MKKGKMVLFGVVIAAVFAGFIFINNEGIIGTVLDGINFGGNGDTNTGGDNEDPSNTYNPNTSSNQDGRFVGNWTYVEGTSDGQPTTHIVSGWINYKADGNWTYSYDYGYTTVNDHGTWQAKDGTLYWGTTGSEISDWYSADNYQFTGDILVISKDGSEARYRKS